jgi:hypothetical protein
VKARLLAAMAATSFALISPVSASGAPYSVHSCGEFVRRSLPVSNWTLIGSPQHFFLRTDCSLNPTMVQGYAPPGTHGGIRFEVRRPLAITEQTVRVLYHAPAALYPTPNAWWWEFQTRETGQDGVTRMTGICHGRDGQCSEQYYAGTIPIDRARAYSWILKCRYESREPCTEGDIQLLEATMKIDDPARPRILGQPGGSIFQGLAPVSGLQTVSFQATDEGTGIYRAVLEVDGKAAAERRFATERSTCKTPFLVPQPCPPRVSSSLTFDTSRYVDGTHQARLRIYDATGANVATYGPTAYVSRNQTLDSYCGTHDPDRVRLRVTTRPIRFGHKWHLTAKVGNAGGWEALVLSGDESVEVLHSTAISAAGYLDLRLPPGPNRVVRLAVRPQGSRMKFVCSGSRRVRVRGRVSLRLSPRHVRVHRSVVVAGRLYGLGHGRKAVVIEAKAAGSRRWATVRVIRTSRTGNYRMRYKFRRTFGRVTYIFRSRVPAERGYAYTTGYSKKRRVVVTG